MFFAFVYKGGFPRASFDGLGEVVKTSRGTVLESAWVFWMRLSIIWRIMRDRGGCYPSRPIRPWWITPSESFIIHSKWFPVQKQAKTYLPPSMLSSLSCLSASLGDKELFSTANSKYSPNSRCRPSSYLLAVLAVFSQ